MERLSWSIPSGYVKIAMENGPFTDDFPHKTSIYNGFSIAMLNYQRVKDTVHPRLYRNQVVDPFLFFSWDPNFGC